jgi:predicted kinase
MACPALASEAVLRQRVAARGTDASETSAEVLVQQLAHREALQPDEQAATMEAATDGPVDVAALWARWRERWA